MINKIRSKRSNATSQVAKDRPDRSKGMISKTVPTNVLESDQQGKGVYHEGYVDGKLFLVPDSNLEAMRDIVNFKMRPRRSVRYKHQTSYEISDYDNIRAQLTRLIEKVDDLSDLNEAEEEYSEEEAKDKGGIKDEDKVDKYKEKADEDEQKLQVNDQRDNQSKGYSEEGEPEYIVLTENEVKKLVDTKAEENEEEDDEESLAKKDPITDHQFKKVQAEPKTSNKDRTDSETKSETESDEECKVHSRVQHDTKPTGSRPSKDEEGKLAHIKLQRSEEDTDSLPRTETETEEESDLDSHKQDESKHAGVGAVKDETEVRPIKLKEEGTHFGQRTETETEEESDLDSRKQDEFKPAGVRAVKDETEFRPIKLEEEGTDSGPRTETETEEESDLDSRKQDEFKPAGIRALKDETEFRPIKLEEEGTDSGPRTETETEEESDLDSRKQDEFKPAGVRAVKDETEFRPIKLEEEGTDSGPRTETETEEESDLDSQKQDESKPAAVRAVKDETVFRPIKLEEEGTDSGPRTETEEESDLDYQKEGHTYPSVIPPAQDQGGEFINKELKGLEEGRGSLTRAKRKSEQESKVDSKSRSVTESKYGFAEQYDKAPGSVPSSKQQERTVPTPTMKGGPRRQYKPGSETKHGPKLEVSYRTKDGNVPNKYYQAKHKMYPKSDKLYVRFLISGHFKNGKKPIYIIQEYNGDNLFQDKKTDIFKSEKKGDIDILISGKYFYENILEESNGKPIALKIKPNKIMIDENKSKVYEELEDAFNMKTALILVQGKFITNPVTKKVTPFIRFDIERKSSMDENIDEQIQNIHNNIKPTTVMRCNPSNTDPFTMSEKSNCGINSYSSSSKPFRTKNISPSLSERSSLEKDVNLSSKQVVNPKIQRQEIKYVNNTKLEQPKIEKNNPKKKHQLESQVEKLNKPKSEGFFNFLKGNSLYKVLFDCKRSKLTSKNNNSNVDKKGMR